MDTLPLNRTTYPAADVAPVRIVHIGLGAFHRAHQAWYTDKVDADRQWGIAAFTGRSAAAAESLSGQEGLYTLVTRSPDGDDFSVVSSIVAANDGADLLQLQELVAAPTTAIITLTVTEAGYMLDANGGLDTSDATIADDIALLRSWSAAGHGLSPGGAGAPVSSTWAVPSSMPARVVAGLDARHRAGAGPLAVVSCDNLAANGAAAERSIVGLAAEVDPDLAAWIASEVSFVGTSIDRITPKTTDDDVAAVAEATGYADRSPVVAEPFHSWVLSGNFPAGRPAWEEAGAVFVEDIEAFERRKLWLLNGAHSLLAYAGQLRGHATVAEALADPACADRVEDFWDEAQAHLTEPGLDVDDYREALRQRFSNTRIAHHLAQIGTDGSAKLRMRAIPVLRAERSSGRSGAAAAAMIAAWIDFLPTAVPIRDAAAEKLASFLVGPDGPERTRALLEVLDPESAAEPAIVELVHGLRGDWA
ncbi:mannitol dehydrogenase family protein [Arthrobacter pigmenti]